MSRPISPPGLARRVLAGIVAPAAMILALPPLGVFLAGKPVSRYMEFPPRTAFVAHASFSWLVFLVQCGFTAAVLAPFLVRAARRLLPAGRRERAGRGETPARRRFPLWGWAGLAWLAAAWIFAWTRLPGLAAIQPHAFTPLWVGYIVTMSALARRRSGHCLLTSRPGRFLLLFPASAAFWWLFEYLNRFVQNWHYPAAVGATAGEYLLYATLPFATVLPATAATREWLLSFPAFRDGYSDFLPLPLRDGAAAARGALLACAAALLGIGAFPNALYPLVWLAPPVMSLSALALAGDPHILRGIPRGDWSLVVSSAAAALVCGFFWEMWNSGSLVRWDYTVPYVDRFRLFGMPAIGYAGYLPFGVMCAAVADLVAAPDAREAAR